MMRRMLLLMVTLCFMFTMIVGSVLIPTDLLAGEGGGTVPPPDTTGNTSYNGGLNPDSDPNGESSKEEFTIIDMAILYFELLI